MRPPVRLALGLLACLVVWLALHVIDQRGTNPVLEARARAEAEGLVSTEADLLGGGYGSQLLRRYAYVQLRERGGERREVTVRMEKWLPFADWTIVAVEVAPAG